MWNICEQKNSRSDAKIQILALRTLPHPWLGSSHKILNLGMFGHLFNQLEWLEHGDCEWAEHG